MVGLRSQYQIDNRGAPDHFRPFRLRHAASDRDREGPARPGLAGLEVFQAAELRIDLLNRFFPNVAGIEYNQIRIGGV